MRWAQNDAAIALTPTLAREAVARAPATAATLAARNLELELSSGRAFVLAGAPKRALPLLQAASARCQSVSLPFAAVESRYWLGRALADTGDISGARTAFQSVLAAWGKAPSSVTARLAAEGLAGLP